MLLCDKIGNAHADRLAGEGADQHQAMISLEEDAQARLEHTKALQMKMLDVLLDRDLGLSELPAHVVDPPFGRFMRGSLRARS